jgi:transitional endoplasmic reticulum ATPase
VPRRQEMKAYVTNGLKKISDQRYTIASGVPERCLSVLAGCSIADADALLNRAVNLAAVRALQENMNELRTADITAAARSVFVTLTRATS